MEPKDVTVLLREWSKGDAAAGEQLLAVVYAELRQMAQRYMRKERPEHTLQPTALVHEAYLRLLGQQSFSWQNRAQFFAVAAREMRRLLVDHARERAAQKRGGGDLKLPLDEALGIPSPEPDEQLLALDESLSALGKIDEMQSRVFELRYFGGLSVEETAEVLGVSVSTVERKWRGGRAYLSLALGKTPSA